MNPLDAYTDEQLQAELDARQRRQDEAEKPQQLEQVNLTELRRLCQREIDNVFTNGRYSIDCECYIYDAAMKAIFGPDVLDWVNERT